MHSHLTLVRGSDGAAPPAVLSSGFVLTDTATPQANILHALQLLDGVEARFLSLALIPTDNEFLDALGQACGLLEDAYAKLNAPSPQRRGRGWGDFLRWWWTGFLGLALAVAPLALPPN